MSSTPDHPADNPYELLDVSVDASETDIKTAYRRISLKVHPDRNPNNPEATQKFLELNRAYELLLNPLRRHAIDASIRAKEAQRARSAMHHAKQKMEQEKLKERARANKKQKRGKENKPEIPFIGDLDSTVKVNCALLGHSDLKTKSYLASLLRRFGSIEETDITVSTDRASNALTYISASVPFKKIGSAVAAVSASSRKDTRLRNVTVTWAEGREPKIVQWLKARGALTDDGSTRTPDGLDPMIASAVSKAVSTMEDWTHTPTDRNIYVSFSFSSHARWSYSSGTAAPIPSSSSGFDYEFARLVNGQHEFSWDHREGMQGQGGHVYW